jgi:hypothetical protein
VKDEDERTDLLRDETGDGEKKQDHELREKFELRRGNFR